MAAFPSQEHQPLKKPRIGPPDVYPQDFKQKEDELSSNIVKHGFDFRNVLAPSSLREEKEEYGSAKDRNITQAKLGAVFSSILAKKEELNTLPDNGKKKQPINPRENFWPVTTKSSKAVEAWFTDLAGNKSLNVLVKKVPVYNKKEEIFNALCEYNVPNLRAAWFVKMNSAYSVAISENKVRRNKLTDPSIDWCQAHTRYMKELLHKLFDYYHGSSSSGTGFFTATASSTINKDEILKQWNYHIQLARHLYEEGLLDRQEFLAWLVEQLEKMKMPDDTIMKMILGQVLQYAGEFVQSEVLSRRLALFCAKKIAQLCNESGCGSPRTQSPLVTAANNGSVTTASANPAPQNPLVAIFAEYSNCPQHRAILLGLSALLQTITLQCPTALLWNNIPESKGSTTLSGSPLDHLPCTPSTLPMPPGPHNQQIRLLIRSRENQIRQRSLAAESRWSSDKCQQSAAGNTMTRTLQILDTLDRHQFRQTEPGSSVDSLYHKVFASWLSKDSEQQTEDGPIVTLLCEWAVSTERYGEHKALVVAKLLEKRQADLNTEKYADSDLIENKNGLNIESISNADPEFQTLLMEFLDTKAPTLDESPSPQNSLVFGNLVLLFCELIRHDVFSHDIYMRTLISRGDLASAPAVMSYLDSMDILSVKSVHSIHPNPASVDPSVHEEMRQDDDMDMVFTFKDESRSSPAQPASVKSDRDFRQQSTPIAAHSSPAAAEPPRRHSRHLVYAIHFPLPQEEYYSHESSQRMITLYGVGKARDDAKHIAKRVSKEITKLFGKKYSIDISADITKSKKKKERDFDAANLDMIWSKFSKLSYYDRHAITSQCTAQVLEQISNFGKSNSTQLPVIENIAFLFELMESCLNISGLVDFAIQLLKELGELEVQKRLKDSNLAATYPTSLVLSIVSILRKYHSCLLLEQEQCGTAFEGLVTVVKHVSDPGMCSSSERCILAYLFDLYMSCSYLKAKYANLFSSAFSRVQQSLYAKFVPSASNLLWDPNFMSQLIVNPKNKPDLSMIKQLHDNPGCKYSFVCNAVLAVVNCQNVERLNDIGILCAELTASCNSLSSEWLGVLKALCCSSDHSSCGFIDVLTQVDVADLSIHDNIAVFSAILVARHCFSLQDLVVHVVLPSLLAARPSAGGEQDAESGARLSCHLVVTLFKSRPQFGRLVRIEGQIKSSSDRHLLEAAHHSIDIGAVLVVLKAMPLLGDSVSVGGKSRKEKDNGDLIAQLMSSVSDDDELGSCLGLETGGLSVYAKRALRSICNQEWVRDKFLRNPEKMFTEDLLLDPRLSDKQAQQLLYMICYPGDEDAQKYRLEQDQRHTIANILTTLDKWFLRISWMELQLMFKQATSSEMTSLLENISKATIEVFQQQTEHGGSQRADVERDSVWLVGPLIARLPGAIQGRVLKSAGHVLESGNNFWSKSKVDRDKLLQKSSLLSHQPFLSLVLNCLKGQDEQREGLLTSLHTQLEKFTTNAKEHDKLPDDPKLKQLMYEALQLRLSLVGGMFDTIQRNNGVTQDWAILLIQLVTNGVIDLQNNSDLFTVVVDMMVTLIHGTIAGGEGLSEKGDDSRKAYLNLMRKLKKEVVDKVNSESILVVRQLLPLPKVYCEVVTTEPHGNLVDTKGNKITDFVSINKKKGLQVANKVKVSPWDLLEGHKNPAPLSWVWFGAVKMERKPLKYEEQNRLLLYHSHSLQKSMSYFLEAPPLPPEDLEPPPEKVENKSQDQEDLSKTTTEKKTAKPPRKGRRSSRAASTSGFSQSPVRAYGYGQEPALYQPGPPASWSTATPSNTAYQQQQQTYYGQQHVPSAVAAVPRFRGPSQSKQALSTMLRARQPASQSYLSTNNQPNLAMLEKQRQNQIIRARLQAHQQQRQLATEGGMYGRQMSASGQPSLHQGLGPQGPGPVPQTYPNYTQGGLPPQGGVMMEQSSGDMLPQNYGQPYQSQSSHMPPPMRSQQYSGGYNNQPPVPQRTFSQQPSQGFPSSMGQPSMGLGLHSAGSSGGSMTAMGSMSGYSQMGPSGPQQQGPGYMQNVPTPQQQQLLRQRQQQLYAMKQQQQQQQQQNAALVQQLQHPMPGQPPQQPPPQYGGYPQPPPQY